MNDLSNFVSGLPKAELQLHLEGSLEPEQMFAFARRNKVEIPFATVEEVRAAYSFSNLQDFLDIYYQGATVLRTAEDFRSEEHTTEIQSLMSTLYDVFCLKPN